MVAEIERYIEIQNSIEEIVKNSPFKMSYIIEKSGITRPTFLRKLKQKKFQPEELLQIAKAVEQPKYRNETKEEILESFKVAEEDIKYGRTTSLQDWKIERDERMKKIQNAQN